MLDGDPVLIEPSDMQHITRVLRHVMNDLLRCLSTAEKLMRLVFLAIIPQPE